MGKSNGGEKVKSMQFYVIAVCQMRIIIAIYENVYITVTVFLLKVVRHVFKSENTVTKYAIYEKVN